MTAIANSENFQAWFKSLGGSLIFFDYSLTQTNANFRPLKFSSLKINPELTKQRHNYKFKSNNNY
jgi:hypothetical protein